MQEEENVLRLLGASYRTAPVEVRESLTRVVSETRAGLLQTASGELELMVLSTCNRTEIYAAAPPGAEYVDRWLGHVAQRALAGSGLPKDALYHLRGETAVRHLFRVACALDSAVLGDVQILSQIKKARAAANDAGTLGGFLRKLLEVATQAGKRARQESRIGYGSASVGSALISMLENRPGSGSWRILLIGAGSAARNIGLHLRKSELGTIVCINRTREHADALALRLGGESRAWTELERTVLASDLVIAATSATEPILTKDALDTLAVSRRGEPTLIVDAGLPRNVEPGSSLDVIGIDQVRERQEHVIATRRASVPAVERILEDAVHEWRQWLASRPIEAIVRILFQRLPGYTRDAASRLVAGGSLSVEDAQRILTSSVGKLLHDHAHRLRALDVSGGAEPRR